MDWSCYHKSWLLSWFCPLSVRYDGLGAADTTRITRRKPASELSRVHREDYLMALVSLMVVEVAQDVDGDDHVKWGKGRL
jgi:hypothetical protein